MAGIPSPIRKWVRRYITGEGSEKVASQSPVQSVNSQTGDVTISTGGGVIPSSQTVASYYDLPTTDRSQAEIWFVTGENDIVASTQLSPVVWRSMSDFTVVASGIPDSAVWQIDATELSLSDGDGVTSWDIGIASGTLTGGSPTYDADGMNGNPLVDGDGTNDYLSGDDSALPLSDNARTIIIVHRVETLQTEYLFEYGSNSNNGYRWTMQIRDTGDFRLGIRLGVITTAPVYSSGENYITSLRYPQSGSLTDIDIRIGQTDEPIDDSTNPSTTVDTRSGTVDVFNSDRLDSPTDGGISEIIVYNTNLSDTVWTDEIDRLANKWGLTV